MICLTRRCTERRDGTRLQTFSQRPAVGCPILAFGRLRPCPLAAFSDADGMTSAVAQILKEFERLSDAERRELRRAIQLNGCTICGGMMAEPVGPPKGGISPASTLNPNARR